MFFATSILGKDIGTPLSDVKMTSNYRSLDFEGRKGQQDIGCLIAFLITVAIGLIILIFCVVMGNPSEMTVVYTEQNFNSSGKSFGSDFISHVWMIFVLAVIALILGYGYILLLKYFVKPMVWCSIFTGITLIFVVALIFVVIGIFFFRNDSLQSFGIILIVFAVILIIVGIIVCVIVYFIREKIRLAIQLMKEACMALRAMPLLPLSIVVLNIVELICFGCFMVISVFGIAITTETNVNGVIVREQSAYVPVLLFVASVIYVWITFFAEGFNQSVIAGAVASWYFTHKEDGDTLEGWPIWGAIKRIMSHHLGSIAFGSGIITLINTLKRLAEMAANSGKGQNGVIQLIAAIAKCLLKSQFQIFQISTNERKGSFE
ncbi:MAG: hypothetical protein EZS28_024722 [Streblomastix strix]|uniref:Choline transporter-like protein n=1 Tax=Streblomastix strix TaxID=222440 RepID=A0A5J4VB57_9EUKA|nr:MAG: hypothetical protein EZS28_024722 [Streblomastix strix]